MKIKQKVKLTKLLDYYESKMDKINGPLKRDYVGQTGVITNISHFRRECEDLFDVKFSDGQTWCCEKEQLEEAYE